LGGEERGQNRTGKGDKEVCEIRGVGEGRKERGRVENGNGNGIRLCLFFQFITESTFVAYRPELKQQHTRDIS